MFMTKFIIINIVLLIVWSMGYVFIRNNESKSLFMTNIFSDIWFYYFIPIIGFIVNIMAFITSSEIRYLVLGLMFLAFLSIKLIFQNIIAKLDRLYYKKNMPIIKEKLDRYLNSSNLKMIEGYNISLNRTAYTNGVVLKIKDYETFDWAKYPIYKNEIEFMLFEYKVRVSYKKI